VSKGRVKNKEQLGEVFEGNLTNLSLSH